jgi:hypothetical protein
MKILTLQQLWSHCLFCPVCQDITRSIYISVGPDEATELQSFKKDNHILHLHCQLNLGNRKFFNKYQINCLDNSFTFDISEPELSERSVTRASSAYFYFIINSDCRKCNSSYSNSGDLEFDFLNHKITNVGIERDSVYLLNQKDKFHITTMYLDKEMIISQCYQDDDGGIIDDNKPFTLPIISFDYSKPRKVVNKIKTLLVFS